MFDCTTRSLKIHEHLTLKKRMVLLGSVFLIIAVLTGCGVSTPTRVGPSPTSRTDPATTALAQGKATAAAQQTAFAQEQLQNLGPLVDMTGRTSLTIAIEDASAANGCHRVCFSPGQVKVKIGTTITWTNQSSRLHTVTAAFREKLDVEQLRIASQIFDSSLTHPLRSGGGTFMYTVTEAAYTLNSNHQVFYYDQISAGLIGVLIIVA